MCSFVGLFFFCEALVAFRKEEATLAHLLDVFVYDPLVEWTLSESKDFQNKKHNDLKLSLDYISTHFTNTVKSRRELHNKYRTFFLKLTQCYRDLKVLDNLEETAIKDLREIMENFNLGDVPVVVDFQRSKVSWGDLIDG